MRVRIGFIVAITMCGLMACSDNPPTGGGPVGSVIVGPNQQFTSSHNGSTNPAVDTIPVGGTVTWTWSGNLVHSVRSVGLPQFQNGGPFSGSGTHVVTFTSAGTYEYDCSIHPNTMSGRVVVR